MKYDVIVVGAGHAGCEAACAASGMGAATLLIAFDMARAAQMSCNPAMGGIAKGQIVREIDALGGQSAIITDRSSIQFRMLNRSKGPAMWSPRSQCDRMKFSAAWRAVLEQSGVDFWQDEATSLMVEGGCVRGVETALGVCFEAGAVVLAGGTFLNGLMHVGRVQREGGRVSEPLARGLTAQLCALGFEAGRMKTGTPPRIDGRSVDFAQLQRQDGDPVGGRFSFLPQAASHPLRQRPCYIAFTNPAVHRTLERGFADSPLYNGTVKSIGPRYCPSIEDKLVTFAAKDEHHLFLEPEGEDGCEYYVNGFSSSLPLHIQWAALQKVKGLENVKLFRAGYAIEYDYFPPTQLHHTLETKLLRNLYFAGQINGTTGYEEAAAQGLMAGINAALKLRGDAPFVLRRDEAYIGVLIDDLTTKGVDEPYRMFTSRAEYRILLRQDDADARLTPLSERIGLAQPARVGLLREKIEWRDRIISFVHNHSVSPAAVNVQLAQWGSATIRQSVKLSNLLARPQVSLAALLPVIPEWQALYDEIPDRKMEIVEAAEILMKYAGYIERERQNALKLEKLEHILIPAGYNFRGLQSLSTEARTKLSKLQPATIGQASRIPGVSPSDVNVLLVRFGR